MKTTKLPDALTIALARYFLNHQLSQRQCIGSHSTHVAGKTITVDDYVDGRAWDKQADLQNIAKVCRKLKWGYQAIAGTFWLFNPEKPNTHFHINEQLWPLATIEKNLKKL